VKGNWKTSEEDSEAEATSYLYTTKLGYIHESRASIAVSEVEKMAKENDMSYGEILSHC